MLKPRQRVFTFWKIIPRCDPESSICLKQDGACCIVGESAQAVEALESVPTLRPDLVIADLVLEGQSGLDFLKLSFQSMPELSVLVYSMHEEKYYAERVLTAGVRGYLMKSSQPETLVHAVG